MCAHKMQRDGLSFLIFFYAPEVCIREKRIFYPEEAIRLQLTEDRIKTAFSAAVCITRKEDGFLINEKKVAEGSYCVVETAAKEEILLVIVQERNESLQCGRIGSPKGRMITIGSDFHNEVFYEYFSFLHEKQLQIYKDENNIFALICESFKEQLLGIAYLNGKAVKGKVRLEKGDRLEIYGLCMTILPEMLLCTCFFGSLRIARRRGEFWLYPKETGRIHPIKTIREGVIEEEQLRVEELELEQPEPKRKQESQPLFLSVGPSLTMVLPVLMMMLFGNTFSFKTGAGFYGMTFVTVVTAALLSFFWGTTGHLYKRNRVKKEEQNRKEQYCCYLEKTDRYLSECEKESRNILFRKYPSCKQLLGEEEEDGMIYWNRSSNQADFLFVRLGLSDISFPIQLRFSPRQRELEQDNLLKDACGIFEKYRYLTKVPVGIDLRNEGCIGFAGENIYPVLLQFLVQLAACHNYKDLKLVYFYHENIQEEKEIANCVKWLPHIWQEERKIRFLAGNEKEAGEILPYLTGELQLRAEESAGEKRSFYVVVVTNGDLVKGEGIYRYLTDGKTIGNYCAVFCSKERKQVPGDCNCLVIKERNLGELLLYEKDRLKRKKIELEYCLINQTEDYMRQLTLKSGEIWDEEKEVPDKLSFLDLYSCSRVEELHCLTRWSENRAGERIRVPVGKGKGNRLIYLDIHEKFHGPHGLIAGTTGSGKSELLQTYLLSLAVSFGPEEMNFFIIDYKGGGMGNVLLKLPHCAGVISNLSGRQIRRALLSIKSENTRRQRLFEVAGVSHVDDYGDLYRKGRVSEAIPHLVLVVDEFAELKKEEPEFMQEMISVAQIGRSLGVHLILATQKPSGTIDDKIFSNTRFRLCLRVADRQDSMDMLHRPEASCLTQTGRCYLQIGNNELFELFQTGYSKEIYEEKRRREESAVLVSNTGKRWYGDKSNVEKKVTQLEKIIDYVNQTAQRAGNKKAKKLWMEELPSELVLGDIVWKEKQDKTAVKICLGLYDDPQRQRQGVLFYEPVKEGHLCLCGMPATGKSTFLQTMLFQLCQSYTASQIQFLLVASQNAGVNCYEDMPHCMGILKRKQDTECFFYHVEELLKERKTQLSGINYQQYWEKEKRSLVPILFLIDNYGSFRELTDDRYQSVIEKLAKEGMAYGIYLVITALGIGNGEVSGNLFEKMKVTLSLEMNDKVQYGDILRKYQLAVRPASHVKGRGLCKVEERILEFQVPLFDMGDDYERVEKIKVLAKKLTEEGKEAHIFQFPQIPETILFQKMYEQWSMEKVKKETVKAGSVSWQIPLGYLANSGYIQVLEREHFPFFISGSRQTGKRNLLYCLMRGLTLKNNRILLFDRGRGLETKNFLEEIIRVMDVEGLMKGGQQEGDNCLVISDLVDFVKMLSASGESGRKAEKEIKQKIEEGSLLFLATCRAERESEIAGTFWYELLRETQNGIHLGGNALEQRLLSFDDLSYGQLGRREEKGIGYLKLGAGTETRKVVIPIYERGE